MYRYRLYGLLAASDFPLPELLPADAEDVPAELSIRLGKAPADGLVGGVMLSPDCQVAGDEFWLAVPEVARYRVKAGREIVVEPAAGADAASVRLYLLGSCLGALLYQRGWLLLHGNAIRVGDGCLVCVGDSGAGKSTLTAAFLQRGCQVLADDVVPVNDAGEAIPGYPRIKLWQDAADRLGLTTTGLRRISPELEKFNYPLGDRFCATALPIRWLYVLEQGAVEEPAIQPIEGVARFTALRDNSYRFEYLAGMGLLASHLRQCATLANRTRIATLTRPAIGYPPARLADRLLLDAHTDH
ncbi:MAG: hypothetical protein GW787_00970 [Betaproteobacteria bacterium]|nr:hypothetical protein [Betaproteobacteria bacterium]